MKTICLFTLALAAVTLTTISPAGAQNTPPGQRIPDIGYVYPAGGQQGASIQVEVGGQYLDGVHKALFSGGGVTAKIAKHTKPMTPGKATRIREKMDEQREALEEGQGRRLMQQYGFEGMLMHLAEQAGISEDDMIAMKKFREARNDPKIQLNPAIGEVVYVDLEISPDAEPGERELRLMTATGLSDPVRFHIGKLPEYREQEPNDKKASASLETPLPATINGQILPGDVDRFRFAGKKGQSLVVAASARTLIPHLADAVPGWFQATLALYDADGRELAYADDFRFNPDPVLHYEIPEDGEYELEIKDAIYRGREDFVYRVTLGELPFVTSIFPMGARSGSKVQVELTGWNLPQTELTLDTAKQHSGVNPIAVIDNQPNTNLTPFALDTLPEALEQEPNNVPENAQDIRPPLIVNGRINEPGDWDVYRFDCRKGGQIFAEIEARRLNSPVDSLLRLTDAEGNEIAANDDHEDKGAGLVTHHADSRLGITIPEGGTYYLHVGDTQQKGGEAFGYRLNINAQRPDFELRVVPSSISARPGTTVPITVHALRRDGFAGDITLALKDAPKGFLLGGGWVPGGQDRVRATLTVPFVSPQEPISLALEGRAEIDGKEVVREAVPAEDMMQAFIYRHLVPANDWMISIAGGTNRFRGQGQGQQQGRLRRIALPPQQAAMRPFLDEPVKLRAGGTAEVQMPLPGAGRIPNINDIELELSDPPEGIAIAEVRTEDNGVTIQFQTDREKVDKKLRGNLIVDAYIERPLPARDGQPQDRTIRVPLGTLPAIPFEITEL